MTNSTLDHLLRDARIRNSLPPPHVCRYLRERVGLTQADIADLLGVSRPEVSRWENGGRSPRRSVCLEYALLLQRLADEEVRAA